MKRQAPSNVALRRRADAFARLDALPRKAIRNLPYARIASMAMTSEIFVRVWVEERGHTDLLRLNVARRDAVFARLDALPIEQLRGASNYQISRWGHTSILYVRTWIKARDLGEIVGSRRGRNEKNNL